MKIRNRALNSGGATVEAVVAGGRGVERLRNARLSTVGERTLISSRLAGRLQDVPGPRRCTDTVWGGRICGPTAKVGIFVDNCRAATVQAVVAPLPHGLDLAVARDVLRRTVRMVDFGTGGPTVYCSTMRRR